MPVSAAQRHDPQVTVLHGDHLPDGLDLGDARFADSAESLVAALPGSEVLLVWDFLSDAVRDAWPAADTSALRWVHTASAGVDRLTFPGLVDAGITVTNSRGVFDVPIAEYVLGLVLAQAKDLARTLALQGGREWRHRETERVAGRRAVVVGGGPIGAAIAGHLRAVGMQVDVVGRREFPDLPQLLPQAAWLVLAVPLTEATRGMLDAAALALLPPQARVVNVGRGALVVEDDLVAALREGRIAGAALDVFATEPLPASSPLWELPGVIVSPHMSGDVAGWRAELAEIFAANLARYRAGEPLANVVDMQLGYVRGPS
ncbi:D-2-hydroxyacid dehydrogenase [Pseudonocardia sp. CA-107938]|uniref:D-2-hydroxyacid dehydrogenase n=1 Tax=Pseudonocardia sp. CA-107938 TaxID=3240021 RepID=UPI003D9018A3